MVITSLDNEKVKYYSKLAKKKYRDLTGEFIVEGMHLVLEAYKTKSLLEVLILEDEAIPIDVPCYEVTYEVLKKIDSTIGKRILIIDEVQDPGNLGTIIRSAVAFDIDTIVIGNNTTDPYSPKVIRATQGMIFHTTLVFYDIERLIPILKKLHIPILATNVKYGEELSTLSKKEKETFALIIGNEGSGVNPKYLEKSDKFIYIPMNEVVESLNVGVATSIILFEMRKDND